MTDIVVIFPFRIPLPYFAVSAFRNALVNCRAIPSTSEPPRRQYLYVNYLSAPIIAVLLLLATQAINGTVLRHGIFGADGIQPINIMALFISLVRDQRIYPALRLMMRLGTAGIYLNFFRRHWLATFPRILGCEERRRVWTEAALLPLSVLLDMCCSGRKRKLQMCIIKGYRPKMFSAKGSRHLVWYNIPSLSH